MGQPDSGMGAFVAVLSAKTTVLVLGGAVISIPARAAQDSLSEPAGSGVLLSAVQWLQGTLLGTLATAVAVIAVAFIGFGMLSGRFDARRTLVVTLGCFAVFGAPLIAAGLVQMVGSDATAIAPAPPTAPPLAPPAPSPQPYDPYAGASVPVR